MNKFFSVLFIFFCLVILCAVNDINNYIEEKRELKRNYRVGDENDERSRYIIIVYNNTPFNSFEY